MKKTTETPNPSELRRAAEAIAHRRYPDQAGGVSRWAFSSRKDAFCEVRMTGGSVLILRSEAEREALAVR